MTERISRVALNAQAVVSPAPAQAALPSPDRSAAREPVTLLEPTTFTVNGATFTAQHPELSSYSIELTFPRGSCLTDNGDGSLSPSATATSNLGQAKPLTSLTLNWTDGNPSTFRFEGFMPGIVWAHPLRLIPHK